MQISVCGHPALNSCELRWLFCKLCAVCMPWYVLWSLRLSDVLLCMKHARVIPAKLRYGNYKLEIPLAFLLNVIKVMVTVTVTKQRRDSACYLHYDSSGNLNLKVHCISIRFTFSMRQHNAIARYMPPPVRPSVCPSQGGSVKDGWS